MKHFDVTLRNRSGKAKLLSKESVDVIETLGGKFADVGSRLSRKLEIEGGVQVVDIKVGGILSRARVKRGYVITHINDKQIYSLKDIEQSTEKVRAIDGIYPNGRAASYTLVE